MGRKTLHVELLRHTVDSEEVIAMGAKLCYAQADIDELKAGVEQADQTRFIGKLMDLGHLSPIEHATFTFGMEGVSRSLLAQITRHRLASFSVQSQRYVTKMSSQSADGVFDYILPPRIADLGEAAEAEFDRQMRQIQAWYDAWNVQLGQQGEASNEDARFVLPNAAETKLMVTMNARELQHFFRLRCCNRAQWEIRALAQRMLQLAQAVAPTLFKNAGPGCLAGHCPEGKMTCGKIAEVRRQFAGPGQA